MSALSPVNKYGSEPDQVSALVKALQSGSEPSFVDAFFIKEEKLAALVHLRPFVMVEMGWGSSQKAQKELDYLTDKGSTSVIAANNWAWRSLAGHAGYVNRLSAALQQAPGRPMSGVRSDLESHLLELGRNPAVVTSVAIVALANPAVARWLGWGTPEKSRFPIIDFDVYQLQASALVQKLSPPPGHPNDFETKTTQGRVALALRLVELIGGTRAETRAVSSFFDGCRERVSELEARGAPECEPLSRMLEYLERLASTPNHTLEGIRYTGKTNELIPYDKTSDVSVEARALGHLVDIAASNTGSRLSEWLIEAARFDIDAADRSDDEQADFRAAVWQASRIDELPRVDENYLRVGLTEPPGRPMRNRPETFSRKLERLLFTAPTDVAAADELAELATQEGVEVHGVSRLLSAASAYAAETSTEEPKGRLKSVAARLGRKFKRSQGEVGQQHSLDPGSLPEVDDDCHAMLVGYAEHLFWSKHPSARKHSGVESNAGLVRVNGVERPAEEVRELLVRTAERHVFAGGADRLLGLDSVMQSALGPLRTNAVRSAAGTEVVLADLMYRAAMRRDEDTPYADQPVSFSGRLMSPLAGFLLHRRDEVGTNALDTVRSLVEANTHHTVSEAAPKDSTVRDIDVVELARRMTQTEISSDDWSAFGAATRRDPRLTARPNEEMGEQASPRRDRPPSAEPSGATTRSRPAARSVPLRLASSGDTRDDEPERRIGSPSLVGNRTGLDAPLSEVNLENPPPEVAGYGSTTHPTSGDPDLGTAPRRDMSPDGLTP